MNAYRMLEVITGVLVLIGLVFGTFFYLEERHASRQGLLRTEVSLRKEILDRDIKKNAEARVYYKDKAKQAPLDQADEARLEYLEEVLDQKYDEQKMLMQKELELK